ncbi:hypothetical protein D0T49_04645 [Paludibacter sp. 221]|uniref:hypothetical protein n=1 Tax=Paludibacter sp. 221 TaxID=2302939 RepID=UPI0013D185C4|nr:hypothetical protein [Paludibacter sp. 221]NDV46326.1 hypothetical protein [Paludibacter sp. 221]
MNTQPIYIKSLLILIMSIFFMQNVHADKKSRYDEEWRKKQKAERLFLFEEDIDKHGKIISYWDKKIMDENNRRISNKVHTEQKLQYSNEYKTVAVGANKLVSQQLYEPFSGVSPSLRMTMQMLDDTTDPDDPNYNGGKLSGEDAKLQAGAVSDAVFFLLFLALLYFGVRYRRTHLVERS